MSTANSRSNQYWNGSNGQLWANDREFDKVKEFEIKMMLEWEDIPDGMKTDRMLLGTGYEGKFSYRKSDTNHKTVLDLAFEDLSNGIVPEISLVGKAFNRTSGKTERVKIVGITFDELTIQNWSEKSSVEVEVPFKAYDVEILQ